MPFLINLFEISMFVNALKYIKNFSISYFFRVLTVRFRSLPHFLILEKLNVEQLRYTSI